MGLLNARATIACTLSLALAGCGGLRLERFPREKPGDWLQFARTPEHSAVAADSLRPPLVLAWEADATAGLGNGSPVIEDSIVFIGNLRGELVAFALSTGKRLGRVNLGDAVQGSPVIEASVAYVALSNTGESLAAFDLMTGRPRWKKRYGDIEVSPLLYRGALFLGNTAGTFFSVERETGEQKWRFAIPENARYYGIRSSPAADSATVVFGADDGWIYALDAAAGTLRWKFDTGGPVSASPLISGGMVFVGNLHGSFVALDLAHGTLLSRADAGSAILANAVASGENVIVGTAAGAILAYRKNTVAWRAEAGGPVAAGGVIAGGIFYVGTLHKQVLAFNAATGALLWSAEAGGRIHASPAVAGRQLYIATDDPVLRAYREERP
jgi:outer membrane protein assembly factor BamB